MTSRLAALFLVALLYEPNPDTSFVRLDGQPPRAQWYPRSSPNPSGDVPRIPEEEIAFKHNLEELIDEIQKDGAKVLLVPFRAHPANRYTNGVRRGMEQEERILKNMALRWGLPLAPFPAEVISPQNWIDDYCHVNGEGNREKAEHILPYARHALINAHRRGA